MNSQVFDHTGTEIEIEAFHHGEFLLEEIEERGLLKKDVAKALDVFTTSFKRGVCRQTKYISKNGN